MFSALIQNLALITAAAVRRGGDLRQRRRAAGAASLDDRALLAEWKPSYAYGKLMQASLALISTVLGLLAAYLTGKWAWVAGAALILAPWPWTILVIMPVNKVLEATPSEAADVGTRRLIERWGRLHAVRSALGVAAALVYLLSIL